MSTLTSATESSPVKVMQVLADFQRGMPNAGTVFVGEERHQVQVYRTARGLMAQCECPTGCPARPQAIQALQIMTDAWERAPRTGPASELSGDDELDARGGLDPQGRPGRPYDGLARATCEADLQPMPVPAWAYDEHGLRRPLCEAEVAADVWYELERALDRLLGMDSATSAAVSHRLANGRPDVRRYYRASWEPALGLFQSAYEVDPLADTGGQNTQPKGDLSRARISSR